MPSASSPARRFCRMFAVVAALTVFAGPSEARLATGCQGFMDAFGKAVGVSFSRALVVGRNAAPGLDYYDVQGEGDADASIACRGDALVRFETRIAMPANARTLGRHERYAVAALQAAAGLDRGRAAGFYAGMVREAQDYLNGSKERGDVYVSGRVERHIGGRADVGLDATETDRTFIVAAQGG